MSLLLLFAGSSTPRPILEDRRAADALARVDRDTQDLLEDLAFDVLTRVDRDASDEEVLRRFREAWTDSPLDDVAGRVIEAVEERVIARLMPTLQKLGDELRAGGHIEVDGTDAAAKALPWTLIGVFSLQMLVHIGNIGHEYFGEPSVQIGTTLAVLAAVIDLLVIAERRR